MSNVIIINNNNNATINILIFYHILMVIVISEQEFYLRQVALADVIIVNKTDLVTAQEMDRLCQEIRLVTKRQTRANEVFLKLVQSKMFNP